MLNNIKPLIVILGPTASGKTSLSIELAQKFSGEIICADSRTVYKYLNIGTAKPTKKEQKITPHYLLDIIKPDKRFSVAEFQKLAYQKIEKILKRGKVPFLVGGTGLYIDAVCEGFIIPKPIENQKLRKKLLKSSLKQLLQKLQKLDPVTFKKIDKKNKRRIIRALEVCLITGQKFSQLRKKSKPDFQVLKIGLKIPREILYQKIDKRINQMVQAGLVYKEIGEYIRGKLSLKEAIEKAKQKTRQFAKRQITWFKRDKKIKWVRTEKEAERLIKKFLI